ncbi:hypothetical protein V2A60_009362 [Cordyceps javanica]
MADATTHLDPASRKRRLAHEAGGQEDELEIQSRKSQMTLHMENQERAFVAASRRTDRSLEARYQSALMASEVHKKRTGKNFRLTHQIVHDEEMYEEEEDEGMPECWPRSQDGSRSRALSQTDAYIAALIARKAGMPNFFEHSHALFAPPTSSPSLSG